MREFDLLVIGGGPAGYAGAIRAAQRGLKVALIEKRELGGTCLNRGCIPTKALFKAQEVLHLVQNAAQFGIKASFEGLDWNQVLKRKNQIVKRLTGGVGFLLRKAGAEIIQGVARFVDGNQIEVTKADESKEVLKARFIFLASGSRTALPPVKGLELEGVIDSEEALSLPSLPERLVVIGGGVIGMELACIFNTFGVQVEVIEMMPKILPPVDSEVTALLTEMVEKRGMKIHLEARVKAIQKVAKSLKVTFEKEGQEKEVQGDLVLIATGRKPLLEGLNIESTGIQVENGVPKTDSTMRTTVPHIYAIGDINGRHMLAHVAYKEAEVAVANLLGEKKYMDYRAVPNCVFCSPEVASVGLSEEEAIQKGFDVSIGKFPFRGCGKALIEGESEGFVKIIACKKTKEILGIHIIGPQASSLIAEATLAMALECTPQEIAETIHAHPTLPEATMEAAEAVFGAPLHFS
ncbi:dihydrolipoyl dehydrogenase [Thermatribacter velox]|uniref:Dihydrolipoyl dehydrogenase n=1 Tax=Thermatribacter velox TaxID=3039681 RepID=A0ABZ2YFP1_9BACT